MRSESSIKSIYKLLGRSPCPAELVHWKVRKNDFDDFDYSRNIQLHCSTFEQQEKLRFLDQPDEETPPEIAEGRVVKLERSQNFHIFSKNPKFA